MSDLELPDVNLLIALLHPSHVRHRQAQQWFAEVGRFATTPLTEAGLIRLALNPAVVGQQATAADALASLQSLRDDPRAEFLPDDASFADPEIGLHGLVGLRQVTDLHLVNLAARHGARLVTFDAKIASALLPRDAEAVLTLS